MSKNRLKLLFRVFFVGIIFLVMGNLVVRSQDSEQENSYEQIKLLKSDALRLTMQWNENSYRQSLSLYERIINESADINAKDYSSFLRQSANLKLSLNETEEARKLLLKSVENDRKKNNFAGESEALSMLAIIEARNNKIELSKIYLERAVHLAEQSKNVEAKGFASFASAEYFYRNQRNIPSMIGSLEKASLFFRQADNNIQESLTLTELAYANVMNNNREKGQTFASQAVEIARTGGDKRSLAFALIALGDAHQRVGNWDACYQAFKEAESLFPDNLDLLEKAILDDRFGVYYETFGDLIQARSYYQKARELFIKIKNLYGSAELSSVIGKISLELGETEEAKKYFGEGLKISFKSNDRYSLAYAYENIGELHFFKEDNEQALVYYQIALDNFTKVGIKHAVATVNEKIGMVYFRQSKDELAKTYILKALEINRQIRSKSGEADNLYSLALIQRSKNKIDDSLDRITKSLIVNEKLNTETANSKLKQSYFSQMYDRYELYINLLMKKHGETPNGNYALQALQAAERSRARSMLETLRLSEAKFNTDADPELVRREREILILLNTKADKLTELLSENAASEEVKKHEDEINALKNELEEIRADFKKNSPLYSEIKNPELFDVGKFQDRVLDENTVLLEFALGKEASYLWLVSKNDLDVYELPPQGMIEPKIRRLLELLTEREMRDGEDLDAYQVRLKAAEDEYNLKAKDLSRELLGAISGKIQNKRLLVVADGILNYFPLSALPAPDAEELLIAKNEIVYQPSAAAISFLRLRQRKNAASKDVLVFADAIFSPNDVRVNSATGEIETANNDLKDVSRPNRQFDSLKNLPRLDASQREAAAIFDIFGASRSLIISGADARRERVLQPDLADYRIVHFATHGLLNEDHPEFSSIVLSRYDERGAPLQGFLRLQDIYNLNLNSDLVVLSACDSAIGKEIKGEGVVSLTRGFMQAGSKSVLSSLWKVEDNAAAELMRSFYQKMADENLAPSEALRRAQLEMSRDPRYASPFYWAAFTLQGEYVYAVEKPAAFSVFYPVSAGGLILLFGGIFVYRKFYRRGQRIVKL